MTGSRQQPPQGADAAGRFAAGQAAQLAGAVRARGDRQAVARLLAEHDAAHGQWLDALGAVRASAPAAAPRMLALYAFCGHVAGSLEGRGERRGWRAIAEAVDAVLLRCLDDLAAEVVERLAPGGALPSTTERG